MEEDETEEEPTPTLRLIQSELGNVQMSGTALFLFHDSGDQRQLIVLAASKEGLENSVDRLLNLIPLDAGYVLADCLLQGNLALCPTDIADEEVEAELLTGGEPVGMEEEEEEAEEEAAPEDEEEDGEEEETEPETEPEIDAANQGTIALDETVEATLAADERHAWTFADGPAVVDVVLTSGPDLDAVLELWQ